MTDQSLLMLDPGHAFGLRNRTHPFTRENFHLIDQYDFSTIDLEPFKCLVIQEFCDQEFLLQHQSRINEFLQHGKIVIFCGHLFLNLLPGTFPFIPKSVSSFRDYIISKESEHEIFEGVLAEEMTFNKGVAGFFARGTHPHKEEVEVLLRLPGGMPTTYIDRTSTNGTIFVHAGKDLFNYHAQNKSTNRIPTQLLQWVHDEYGRIQGEETDA